MTTIPTPLLTAGAQLREWRRRRRLSQLDVAAATGVSTRHLSFVETDRARPSRELLMFLADPTLVTLSSDYS